MKIPSGFGSSGVSFEVAIDVTRDFLEFFEEHTRENEPYATSSIAAIKLVLDGLPETKDDLIEK